LVLVFGKQQRVHPKGKTESLAIGHSIRLLVEPAAGDSSGVPPQVSEGVAATVIAAPATVEQRGMVHDALAID